MKLSIQLYSENYSAVKHQVVSCWTV